MIFKKPIACFFTPLNTRKLLYVYRSVPTVKQTTLDLSRNSETIAVLLDARA